MKHVIFSLLLSNAFINCMAFGQAPTIGRAVWAIFCITWTYVWVMVKYK
jgi:hypothetical protein